MTKLDHPAVRDYLRRLDAATGHLPGDERDEIREGIRGHLHDALHDDASEADVRNALEALGRPEDIVGAPQQTPPAPTRGAHEIAAVILLLVGGIGFPIVGWIVGVVLLWSSRAWTSGQKVLGTLLFPTQIAFGVLAAVVPLLAGPCEATAGQGSCSATGRAGVFIAIVVAFTLAQIAVAVYLLRAAGRGPARHAG